MNGAGRRRAIAATAVVIVVVGLSAEWLAHGTRLDFAAQRDLLTGWAVAACGLVAWASVPASRIGFLLIATGLTWFIWNLGSDGAIGWIAATLTNLCAGVLAHALLTWPTGRADRPIERALVVGGYLVACFPPLWERNASLLVVAALLVTALVARHVSLPPQARRVRRPALLLGLGLAAALAMKGIVASTLRGAGVAYPSLSIDLWQIAVVGVAVGLTWSFIALERRRMDATDIVVRLGESRPTITSTELADAAGIADDAAVEAALAEARDMSARNAALQDELRAQVRALERSRRRLVEAGDDERATLEAQLRRGPGASLRRLEQALAAGRAAAASTSPDAGARMGRALEQLRLARVELADLAAGLDPGILRERGLEAALADLAGRSPVPVNLRIAVPGRMPASVARTIFYVASEALVNTARHAAATHAWLRLEVEEVKDVADARDADAADPASVVLTIEDDGIGMGEARMGSGLRGLRDRLEALGGSLSVRGRQGGGTALLAAIPSGGAQARGAREG